MGVTRIRHLHHAGCGKLRKVAEVAKMPKKNLRYVGSSSFKVIEFGTNRTGIYDFLLVTNSNCSLTSCTFSEFMAM